jgi:DUF4097 and DUF4098 domain-containing protein YvlB
MTNAIGHRRSIFGPILLIVLGVVFLLVQFHVVPIENAWQLFADYWPVLLIIWGLAKLIDYFAARGAGAPAPRALTGGEVVLLVFLLMFGLIASGINWARNDARFAEEFGIAFGRQFTFAETLAPRAVKPNANISVRLERGDISVVADEGTELRVSVTKAVNAPSESEAQQRATQATLAIHEVPDGYEFVPETRGDWGPRVRLDLEIRVPKQVSITARTARGNISVAGVTGSVTSNSQRGNIEIRGVGGEVVAEVARGDARIIGAGGNVRLTGRGTEVEISDVAGEAYLQGEFYGPIRMSKIAKQAHFLSQRTDLTIAQLPGRMETSSGQIEVVDVPGALSLVTRERDIALTNMSGRVSVQNRRGNVELRLQHPPKDQIEITNESGKVELTLPANSGFEISAASRSGEVECDFQGPELRITQERERGTIEGKIGTRGPRIQIQTTYGTVSIRKGTEAPAPGKK